MVVGLPGVMSWNDGIWWVYFGSTPPPGGCGCWSPPGWHLEILEIPSFKPAKKPPVSILGVDCIHSRYIGFRPDKNRVVCKPFQYFDLVNCAVFFLDWLGYWCYWVVLFFGWKPQELESKLRYEKLGGILGCFWSLSLSNSTKITQEKWYI